MIRLGNKDHGFAIAASAHFIFNPAADVVISRVKDGKLLGGVVFYDYTGRSISMHFAGWDPRWINKQMLWATFSYAFGQLGCENVFAQMRSSNIRAFKIARKVGFVQETIIPDVFPDGDLIILRMRKDKCRWLNIPPYGMYQKAA